MKEESGFMGDLLRWQEQSYFFSNIIKITLVLRNGGGETFLPPLSVLICNMEYYSEVNFIKSEQAWEEQDWGMRSMCVCERKRSTGLGKTKLCLNKW